MEITNKLMFLRYAAPCVDDLVIRNLMPDSYAKEIIKATIERKVMDDSEKQFDLAYIMCQHTAKRIARNKIDSNVIRVYYINLHNNLIGIHKPVACSEDECKIKIVKKLEKYKDCFFRKQDFTEEKCNIIIHRGYIVDLMTNCELEGILSKFSFLETH